MFRSRAVSLLVFPLPLPPPRRALDAQEAPPIPIREPLPMSGGPSWSVLGPSWGLLGGLGRLLARPWGLLGRLGGLFPSRTASRFLFTSCPPPSPLTPPALLFRPGKTGHTLRVRGFWVLCDGIIASVGDGSQVSPGQLYPILWPLRYWGGLVRKSRGPRGTVCRGRAEFRPREGSPTAALSPRRSTQPTIPDPMSCDPVVRHECDAATT